MNRYKVMVLVICSLLLCGCKSDNTVTMVTEAGFAPYEFYENNEIVGVDVEIAKRVANKLGKELVVKDIAFDSIINELKKGKGDFAAAGMSITPERLKEVDFSIEYAISKQVVIVRNDSNITEPSQVYQNRVGVQLGTTADITLSEKMKDNMITRQKKYLTLAEDLKANKVDCIVMDSLPAEQIVKENSNLKILGTELFTDKYGMAVKKGNTEMLNVINEVLQELVDEGKIEEWTIEYTN